MSYVAAMSLLKKGIARPTLYSVSIPGLGEANSQLNFFCRTATVPGVSVETIAAAGQEFHGIVREQPTSVVYDKPFSITVICDKDYIVYKAMRSWFEQSAQNANQILGRSQRMSYYNTIVRDFTLTKLENPSNQRGSRNFDGQSIMNYDRPFKIDFINGYIVRIGPISLASDAFNEMVTFDVDLTYESHSFVEENAILGLGLGVL